MIPCQLRFGVVLAICAVLNVACGFLEESIAVNTDRPRTSRLPPPKVDPITIDNVRYTQWAGKESVDGQVGGFLAAYDAAGQVAWTIKVYNNRRRPELEGDVQDVFFSSMSLEPDGRLRIVNENGDTFFVDVKTRTVTTIPKAKTDLLPEN
jgi:hypothetical protein